MYTYVYKVYQIVSFHSFLFYENSSKSFCKLLDNYKVCIYSFGCSPLMSFSLIPVPDPNNFTVLAVAFSLLSFTYFIVWVYFFLPYLPMESAFRVPRKWKTSSKQSFDTVLNEVSPFTWLVNQHILPSIGNSWIITTIECVLDIRHRNWSVLRLL